MVLNLIVLVVVLALAVVYLIDRRAAHRGSSSGSPGGGHRAHGDGRRDAAAPTAIGSPGAASAADVERARRDAEAEATALLDSAQREAEALRRAAAAEADAMRASAALDAQAAQTQARRVMDEARSAADSAAAQARLEAEAISAAARRDAQATASAAERAAQTVIDAARHDAETAAEAAKADAAALGAAARRAALEEADAEVATRSALIQSGERELAEARIAIENSESQLRERAEQLAGRERAVAEARAASVARQSDLAQEESRLAQRQAAAGERERALDAAARDAAAQQRRELERIAAMSAQDARVEVLRAAESAARRDAARLARDIEAEAAAEAGMRARRIVADSIQRVASEQTAETVVSVMHLASDELKGRIIGREGRNIRAFEAVTGVNVIIDDTPEAVLLSCFDPVRREVGRLTLQTLLDDGRIHPHRIEEVYERSRDEIEALCRRAAQEALLDLGIDDIDPELIPIIGRLRYRTSYGQNVLAHSVESAHVAAVMAAELGLAPAVFQRSAFLHDIGKALTHEAEGSHALVGAALLRRHGEAEVVAHAVEAHHNEVVASTIEDVLTQAADACSAARPGARRESIEAYVKRLARIEEIASAREGVERVYAMQAGREVRVMVRPDDIDDLEAGVIAREVAKQIEDELTYPGQIRVTVVRESRASEIAH